MQNTTYIDDLLSLLREQESFVVTSHARPDGDAIGSALGLMHLLDGMGKRVCVAFADPIPVIYRSLPGVDRIQAALPTAASSMLAPDVAILLECDGFERTGFGRIAFDHMGAGLTVNIDHHLSGKTFASFNWIDPEACAVGAMIYDLAVASGAKITADMATCLYTAVLTDTGSFTYPSTVAATFALAEHLVESGADANKIAQAVYFSNPPSKIRLLGAALGNMQIEGTVAWSWITQEEMSRVDAAVEDCEGIVNYLIGMAGVEAAVFLRELPSRTEFRLSLRSKGEVDVAKVAERFGGGGHRSASGCTLDGPLNEAVTRIVAELQPDRVRSVQRLAQ